MSMLSKEQMKTSVNDFTRKQKSGNGNQSDGFEWNWCLADWFSRLLVWLFGLGDLVCMCVFVCLFVCVAPARILPDHITHSGPTYREYSACQAGGDFRCSAIRSLSFSVSLDGAVLQLIQWFESVEEELNTNEYALNRIGNGLESKSLLALYVYSNS